MNKALEHKVHSRSIRTLVVALDLIMGLGGTLFFPHPVLAAGSGKSAGTHPVPITSPGRQFDRQGRYVGKVDPDGRRYDPQGRYLGRIDPDGRQYNAQGRYLGRTEPNGRRFDTEGHYLGRLEGNGRLYDEQGHYLGRIDGEGRQYDNQGRLTGRLHSSEAASTSAAQKTTPSRSPPAPPLFCNVEDKNCFK